MSKRVYVSIDIAVTTAQEDTPVSLRIQVSAATAKALHTRLQQAYLKDDVRLVRRTTVLIDLLVHHVPLAVLCERWGLSASCLYDWQKAFLLHGLESLCYRHSGGRRPKLTPKQKRRLVDLLEAGPLVVGCETACWDAVLIRVLIWREFGVLYNRQYVWPRRSRPCHQLYYRSFFGVGLWAVSAWAFGRRPATRRDPGQLRCPPKSY
jgi:hypothetical protein